MLREALLDPLPHDVFVRPALGICLCDNAGWEGLFGHSLPFKNDHWWKLFPVGTACKHDCEVCFLMACHFDSNGRVRTGP